LGQLRDRLELAPGLARVPAPGPRAVFLHIKVEDSTSGEETDGEGRKGMEKGKRREEWKEKEEDNEEEEGGEREHTRRRRAPTSWVACRRARTRWRPPGNAWG